MSKRARAKRFDSLSRELDLTRGQLTTMRARVAELEAQLVRMDEALADDTAQGQEIGRLRDRIRQLTWQLANTPTTVTTTDSTDYTWVELGAHNEIDP